MKECKALKQRESDQLKLSVQKQQQELEHMRLRLNELISKTIY